MRIYEENGNIILDEVRDFDLSQTLDCGQSFRWAPLLDGSFRGIAFGRVCRLSKEGDRVIFHQMGIKEFEDIWFNYFDFGTDYEQIKVLISQNEVLKKATSFAPGMRILRQDGWEALCSFIISQNNNIKRIKGILERLCKYFGEPIGPDDYAFPTAERLATLSTEDLNPVRCGFRARYVIDAARKVSNGEVDLAVIAEMPLEDARAHLRLITGVGIKVADCALLFGFGRMECFPVDVWIGRAMDRLLADGLPEYALPYAGIAQQYLFHYVRLCPDALLPEEKITV